MNPSENNETKPPNQPQQQGGEGGGYQTPIAIQVREINEKGVPGDNVHIFSLPNLKITCISLQIQIAGRISHPPYKMRMYLKIEKDNTREYSKVYKGYGLIQTTTPETKQMSIGSIGITENSEILIEKITSTDRWPTETPSRQPHPQPHEPYHHHVHMIDDQSNDRDRDRERNDRRTGKSHLNRWDGIPDGRGGGHHGLRGPNKRHEISRDGHHPSGSRPTSVVGMSEAEILEQQLIEQAMRASLQDVPGDHNNNNNDRQIVVYDDNNNNMDIDGSAPRQSSGGGGSGGGGSGSNSYVNNTNNNTFFNTGDFKHDGTLGEYDDDY